MINSKEENENLRKTLQIEESDIVITTIAFAIIFSNDKRGFNWPRQKKKDLSKIYDMNQIISMNKGDEE